MFGNFLQTLRDPSPGIQGPGYLGSPVRRNLDYEPISPARSPARSPVRSPASPVTPLPETRQEICGRKADFFGVSKMDVQVDDFGKAPFFE